MELIVLMQNDYPIGIYASEEIASLAAVTHYNKHYRRDTTRTIKNFHYRQYPFVIDAEPS